MTIRFIRMLIALLWDNRRSDSKAFVEIMNAFSEYGTPIAAQMKIFYDLGETSNAVAEEFTEEYTRITWRSV